MVVRRRRPYLTKAAFGHETLFAHSIPKRTADCAGVGSPIPDGSHYFNFAGPCITMLAYVAVKAQRLVFASFAHALLLQEVNRKNRSVSAVSATETADTLRFFLFTSWSSKACAKEANTRRCALTAT